MKKIIASFLILIFFSFLPAEAKKTKTFTQLELREIQTRIFDIADKDIVFKAAINTLQDNGFIIQNIEDEVGYIRAKKEFKGHEVDKKRVTIYSTLLAYQIACLALTYGMTIGYVADPLRRLGNELADKTVIIDSNINIEPYGNDSTKVRFTIVKKVLENADGYSYVKSSPRKIVRIKEPAIYTEFFNQLSKNIFYEKI